MIFKEAYSNILKYAAATQVVVTIYLHSDNKLVIMISDNGKGFEPTQVKSGNGLKNIENRVKRMNGELIIESNHGNGTNITINLNTIFI
jgi:signal transduction histidine kinase